MSAGSPQFRSRIALAIVGVLATTFACGGAGEETEADSVRLFERLDAASADVPEPHSIEWTPSRGKWRDVGEDHAAFVVPLPWPASGELAFQSQGQPFDLPVEVTAETLSATWSRQGSELDPDGAFEMMVPGTDAEHIVLKPGRVLEVELPPWIDPVEAALAVSAQGSGTKAVNFSVTVGEAEPATFQVVRRWTTFKVPLEPSAQSRSLRIELLDAVEEEDYDGVVLPRLLVHHVDVPLNAHDVWWVRGPKRPVRTIQERVRSGELTFTYQPRGPDPQSTVRQTRAWSRTSEDSGSTTFTYQRWLPAGPAFLRWADSRPTRVALEGRELALSEGMTAFDVAEPQLARLEVTWPNRRGGSFELIFPEVARAETVTQNRVAEVLFNRDIASALHRVQRGKERRVCKLLSPGEAFGIPVTERDGRNLRFGATLWESGEVDGSGSGSLTLEWHPSGGEAEVIAELVAEPDGDVVFRRHDTPGQEHQRLPQKQGWLDVEIRVPTNGAGTLRFWFDGDALTWDEQSRWSNAFAAVSGPELLADAVECPGGVVLYVADTLRADHLSIYGSEHETTPFLREWSQGCLLFEQAYSVASWTRPSTGSLLTGLHPTFHGANGKRSLSDSVSTLTEFFHEQGYATGAIVMNANVSSAGLGFDRGFETFRTGLEDLREFYTEAAHLQPWIDRWIDRHSHRPFFLYVHVVDPHTPYIPAESVWREFDSDYAGEVTGETSGPGSFLGVKMDERDLEHVRALYDGEIRELDDAVHGLVESLQQRALADDTGVVFVADHGEEFLEHGWLLHGARLYEEQVRVPLVIQPAVRWGLTPRRVRHRVQQVDLMPTLIALEGFAPGVTTGENLVPVLRGEEQEDPERTLYFEEPNIELQGILLGRYKLIRRADNLVEPMLFNLTEDPGESVNVLDDGGPHVEALERQMQQFLQRFDALGLEPAESSRIERLTPEEAARLREVGYVR